MAPITAPGKILQFFPMRDPLKMVTCGITCVPSPISTSPYTTENASMDTFAAIFAFGSTCAKGLIILLRSFYNLCYHLSFANESATNKNSSFHFTYSSPDWTHQFHLHHERIAWNYFLLEFAMIYLEKIGIILLLGIVS